MSTQQAPGGSVGSEPAGARLPETSPDGDVPGTAELRSAASHVTALREESAAAQRKSRRIREKSQRWQQILNDGFAALTTEVEFDLKIRTRAVQAEAERAIDKGDPSRNWAPFEQWLRRRLADETADNYAQLVGGGDDLVGKVGEYLRMPASAVAITDPEPPTEVAEEIETDTSFTERGGLGRTGLAVFRSGYGGFMMFIVLTHYVAAIAVPLPFGVAAGLLMGLAGFADERKRQLERRRTQAKAAVRAYLDQFNLRVAKDSRAALRRMQRELRDGYATRLLAAQRAADDALQSAEDALDAAESQHGTPSGAEESPHPARASTPGPRLTTVLPRRPAESLPAR